MKRPRSIGNATVVIYLLLLPLLLISSGCSTPNKSGSEPTTAPAAWNTPTPVSGPQPNSNGAMVRANVHGTGVYITGGVRELTGLRWEFETNERGSITTPVSQGAVVYFSQNGRLYAVDAATGTEKWHRKLHNISTSAPAVAGDTVYAGAWEELYAFSADTGEKKWVFQPESGSDDRFFIDPVVDGGTVYFGGWSSIYAVNSETGQEKWKLKLSGLTITVPTVYDGTVYVGTYSPDDVGDAHLYALDSETGQEKWKLEATGGGIGGAVAVTGGIAYVSTHDDGLVALDARSGQEMWRYNTGAGITTAPAVAYGTVYITNQGAIYAIDAQTGREKWRLQVGGEFSTDPVIADGIVYFGRAEGGIGVLFGGQPTGYLHAVDAHSGQELWKFSAAGSTSRAPAVAEGTVYFGSDEGTLYAVK